MNRSAYLTTGFAIKTLSRLTRADITVHGQENIPSGQTIFVINHFTRLETLLLPSYISGLTDTPVWSLADASLFNGGLAKFFDLVGAVSTSDPKRDELIVKSLLTGEASWIIFPEGSMVKTKKIMDNGKFMIDHPGGMHEPRTGAAALALTAELYRRYIFELTESSPTQVWSVLESLDIEHLIDIKTQPTVIVPVNLTYYPIRAMENIASTLAEKLVKDISERMVEEIMTEGTMLLSGVDLDIRFGKPIEIEAFLDPKWLKEDMFRDGIGGYVLSDELKEKMRAPAYKIMQQYMGDIYGLTTVNHEHLYASLLRIYPFERIKESDFKRRVFYAASLISNREDYKREFFLHKSLQGSQAHLVTDDRLKKYENFLQLAIEKDVVKKDGDYLVKDRSSLSRPLSYHKGRIDNPIEIMANEVEPLTRLQKLLRSIGRQPAFLLKLLLIRHLIKQGLIDYDKACGNYIPSAEKSLTCLGRPFLLSALRRKRGVVLVHSYLAVPAEVRGLADHLRREGFWVYAPRLPGHGTSSEDLAERKYQEWMEAVERGFVLMSTICDSVVLGGVAVGGSMALNLAARIPEVAGVFAVCPPISLSDYSANFMPAVDVWNRMLNKMKGEGKKRFLDFSHGNPHVNYIKNPVAGVSEVGQFLDSVKKQYSTIQQPALIIQADKNPIVDPGGSRKIYEMIESDQKEYCLLSFDRHILVHGKRADMVQRKISNFIKRLEDYKMPLKSGESKTAWSEYYAEFPYFSEQIIREGCHPRKLEHKTVAEKAIVLVHGLSDSPHFLSAIADFFHFELGYDVYLPLLQGHGLKNPNGMEGVTLLEWKENVRFAIDTAAVDRRSLSIGGLSTGGALGFYMGCTNPAITGDLYLFAAALGLKEGWLGIAGSVKEFLLRTSPALPNDKRSLIGSNPYRYDYVSLNGARELVHLIGEINENIESFKEGDYFQQRIFSAFTECDDVVSLKAISRLEKITKEDTFVQYILPKSKEVQHASVVLKDPIYAAEIEPGEPPLEKANPEFFKMMEAVREFQREA
ncbi:MAG: alpha/beta fold hydrolase [Deltaproteobacteria bacterium]|nr:alpha/beta fold hydrolase [Deltaproteobacteria bacterium]